MDDDEWLWTAAEQDAAERAERAERLRNAAERNPG